MDLGHFFEGKYCTTFTTAINFYDSTAHEYMEAVCNDLGGKYVTGLSHHMRALLDEHKRQELQYFIEDFAKAIEDKQVCPSRYKRLQQSTYQYQPGLRHKKVTTGKRTIIVTDAKPGSNIFNMIIKYESCIKGPLEVINLNDTGKSHYCVGCCNCGPKNQCRFDL